MTPHHVACHLSTCPCSQSHQHVSAHLQREQVQEEESKVAWLPVIMSSLAAAVRKLMCWRLERQLAAG